MATQIPLSLINTGDSGAFSWRNRIINGACFVAQRGSIAVSSAGEFFGGPDRYAALINGSPGGAFTQSQGTIVYGGITYEAVIQTVTTAISSQTSTNFWLGISQRIEANNCYDLVGQAISGSFLFETNVTGTYSISLASEAGTGYYYITTFSATANTPVQVSFTTPILPTGAAFSASTSVGMQIAIGCLNVGGTYATSTYNTWQTTAYYCAASQTNWGATANNYIAVSNLQLEKGSVVTPFEQRPYGIELVLCQRYYEVLFYLTTVFACNGTSSLLGGNVLYQTAKRASPTITFGGSNFSVQPGGIIIATISASSVTTQGATIAATTNSSVTAGDAYAVIGISSIIASAEL